MAVFHTGISTVKRSRGQSVVQRAFWRCGMALYDRRLARRCGVSAQRSDRLFSRVIVPDGFDARWCEREFLWNAVEAVETRKNSQMARELEFALPRELSDADNIDLTVRFATEECVTLGMIADTTVRATSARDGGRNVHAYLLLTMRRVLDGERFGPKERAWNDRALYWNWRERLAQLMNEALERGGHDARVDHRSYAERGIEVTPDPLQQPRWRIVQRLNRA